MLISLFKKIHSPTKSHLVLTFKYFSFCPQLIWELFCLDALGPVFCNKCSYSFFGRQSYLDIYIYIYFLIWFENQEV